MRIRTIPRIVGIIAATVVSFLFFAGLFADAVAQQAKHPLRPPDTTSPRATLQSFSDALNEVYAIASQPDAEGTDSVQSLERAALCLDASAFPIEIRRNRAIEAALMLNEVLDRIDMPAMSTVPGGTMDLPKKWRVPFTPITIELVEDGPRSGEYLFSKDTVLNARKYYRVMEDLPYKDATTPGLYTAYLTTPGRGVELSWSKYLPNWSRDTFLEQTYWQWIALIFVMALLAAAMLPAIFIWRRTPPRLSTDPIGRNRRNQLVALVFGLVSVFGAGWFIDDFVNLTGDLSIASLYILALLRFILLGWIALVVIDLAVDLIIHTKGLGPKTGGALLLRLGSWVVVGAVLAGLIVVAAQSFGFPAYSIVTGLGIGGVAIGFGAQTLVRDVLAGVFFLVDDAFREGEYIQAGGAKGTVEKISVRSLQLRHHNGPVYTVPFGEIRQVNNLSRDWVIMKLPILLPFGTDPERVRKIVKKLGQELLDDPELGPMFIEPLKSQGVLAIDDRGMMFRVKFMTHPGDQFMVRRTVYSKLQEVFAAEGINFAGREVQVTVDDTGKGSEMPVDETVKQAVTKSENDQNRREEEALNKTLMGRL